MIRILFLSAILTGCLISPSTQSDQPVPQNPESKSLISDGSQFFENSDGLYDLQFQKKPNNLTIQWTTDSTLVHSVSIYYSENLGESWRLISGGVRQGDPEWENLSWKYPSPLAEKRILIQVRNYLFDNYCIRAVDLE